MLKQIAKWVLKQVEGRHESALAEVLAGVLREIIENIEKAEKAHGKAEKKGHNLDKKNRRAAERGGWWAKGEEDEEPAKTTKHEPKEAGEGKKKKKKGKPEEPPKAEVKTAEEPKPEEIITPKPEPEAPKTPVPVEETPVKTPKPEPKPRPKPVPPELPRDRRQIGGKSRKPAEAAAPQPLLPAIETVAQQAPVTPVVAETPSAPIATSVTPAAEQTTPPVKEETTAISAVPAAAPESLGETREMASNIHPYTKQRVNALVEMIKAVSMKDAWLSFSDDKERANHFQNRKEELTAGIEQALSSGDNRTLRQSVRHMVVLFQHFFDQGSRGLITAEQKSSEKDAIYEQFLASKQIAPLVECRKACVSQVRDLPRPLSR